MYKTDHQDRLAISGMGDNATEGEFGPADEGQSSAAEDRSGPKPAVKVVSAAEPVQTTATGIEHEEATSATKAHGAHAIESTATGIKLKLTVANDTSNDLNDIISQDEDDSAIEQIGHNESAQADKAHAQLMHQAPG